MRTKHAPNTTGTNRNRILWAVIALAGLLGVPMMLLTFAVGAGDTSVGNSSGPWVTGYGIVFGIPVAAGVASYVALRRGGSTRGQAIFTGGVAATTMFIVPIVIAILFILFS